MSISLFCLKIRNLKCFRKVLEKFSRIVPCPQFMRMGMGDRDGMGMEVEGEGDFIMSFHFSVQDTSVYLKKIKF